MMKATRKEIKQNSFIHQKIRNAKFVTTNFGETERFKYNLGFKVNKYINDKFIVLKTTCNKILQKPKIWFQYVDFKAILAGVSIWFSEALIEGFVINFIVWALLGWKFNLITWIAWGFVIKESLSIYWQFRKNGSTTTIPKKDE